MQSDEIIRELMTFTQKEILDNAAEDLDAETPLLELGVLDSLSMVSLLSFIDERYGVKIPEESVLPEHFENLATVAALILELQGPASAPAQRSDELLQLVKLQQSYGIESKHFDLGRGRTLHALCSSGRSPTWVFLPALGNPSTAWSPLLRTINGDQSAFALDLAGFGLSAMETERPTYADHLTMLQEALDQIPGPLVLIGNSAGVPIATALAKKLPERVKALIATGFGLIEDVPAWWAKLQVLSKNPADFMRAAYHRPPKLTAALTRLLEDALARPAYHSFLDAHGMEAMATAFDGIQVPTLFIQGESDEIIPRAAVEAAVKRIPGARIEWLARCGHFAPAERPEPFLWFVQQFLAALDVR